MLEENKSLIRKWFEEVWNKGNSNAIAELTSENLVVHGLTDATGNPITDAHAFREFHQQFRNAFPDIAIVVEDCLAEGDKVAARCTVKAKHTGDSLGVAATHADVDFTGIAIVRVYDGKIIEAWNNFDFLKMNRQLGIL